MATKKTEYRLPTRLQPGDTLGIVAPAGHFDLGLFQQGLAVLEDMGFRPVFDEALYEKEGTFAGTDAHRAGQVNRFFGDETIAGIICARGGYGALRTLSLLDLKLIRGNPKCFLGFSDISALLSVLSQKCGFSVFHGPNVTSLAKAPKKTLESFFSAMTSDSAVRIRVPKGDVLNPGTATARVAGGNLATLCHLLATPFQPDFKNRILLLEDVDEAPYRIDRMLTQMKLAGCLDGISGLLLGAFTRCGKKDAIHRVIMDRFGEYDIPILTGLPVGHGRSNLTIPIGVMATLDTDQKTLAYKEAATA